MSDNLVQAELTMSTPEGRAGAVPAALGGLIAIAAALGVGRFVYTPILPLMIEALRLSASAAGLIASANFLGYLLGAVLAGVSQLPGSRRQWCLGALAVSAITTAAMGLARTLAAFLVLRFAGGAASALVLVLASSIVLERLAAAGRVELSALHFSGVGVGIAASAALVAAMLYLGQDWRTLWLVCGGLALAALLAAALLLPDGAGPADRAGAPPGGPTGRGLGRMVVAYGLFGFGYVITATFLAAIVRNTPAIRGLGAVAWVMFGVAAAPSVALWTRLARSLGAPTAFAVACIVEAAGVLASVGWLGLSGVVLAAILVGGTFMGLTALGLEVARRRTAGDPRRVLALMTGAFGLGQMIGPLFAGVVSDRLGGFTVPSIAAAVALVVAAALAVTAGSGRSPREPRA